MIARIRNFALIGLFALVCAAPAARLAAGDVSAETPEQKTARMKWFADARFGMFIHWGVYSVPAGEIEERVTIERRVGDFTYMLPQSTWKKQKDFAEWFLEETHLPVSQYEKFAEQFNPVKFDAKQWIATAKGAGMKYIVITSKHHDGFGMWPSEQTDWCIKNTPFKRDPLKELSEACREAGIKFCLYHSIMDWHHPDWGTRRAWNDKAKDAGKPDMDRYTKYMKRQLKELITNYHPGILWFDGEWEGPWTTARGEDLYAYVRNLQPDIIINNRVGKARNNIQGMDKGKGVGDYGTPEQNVPDKGFGPGVYWESCMTMNDHWGYNKADHDWKSPKFVIQDLLVDCASKGGNLLLNVGPTSEGVIPAPCVERLGEIGKWMKVNGESVYGTSASTIGRPAWGRSTTKGDTIYLHVYDWPKDGKLTVKGLENPAQKPWSTRKAWLLSDAKKTQLRLYSALEPQGQNKSGAAVWIGPIFRIDVPVAAPDKIDSVIVLE